MLSPLVAAILLPGSVTLKNGEKLEAPRVEGSLTEVVLHLERGTITLPRKDVASIDAGTPAAAPATRPDRVAVKAGGFVEGAVTAQEKDVVKVRVRGGIAEIDAAVVASIERGGAKASDLEAADASEKGRLAEADAKRRDALAAYAAFLGAGRAGNRGEAVPAALGAGGEEAAGGIETALEDVAARRQAFRLVESFFRSGPYPDRLYARNAVLGELFPGYVAPVYDAVIDRAATKVVPR